MAQYKSKVKTELLKQVGNLLGPAGEQGNFEFEARIGKFRDKRFISSIESRDFYRVLEHFLDHLNELYVYVPQIESVITEKALNVTVEHMPDAVDDVIYELSSGGKYPQRIRESYVPSTVEWFENAPKFYSLKRNRGTVDLPDHFVRFAKSFEQALEPTIKNQLPAQPQALRKKERWSFEIPNQGPQEHPLFNYRVDMTRVKGWTIIDGNRVPIDTREIELEVIRYPINNVETELWPGIQFILQILQNTPFPITAGTTTDVIRGFNMLFKDDINRLNIAMKKKNPRWSFPETWKMFNIVNKPINLKLNILEESDTLAITDKADGERKLMFIRSDGAYLLYPPFDVMRYLKVPIPGQQLSTADQQFIIDSEVATALDGTVFDGELVLREDGKREYLAFDLLVSSGNDYRQVQFSGRIKRMQKLLEKHSLNIGSKKYSFPEEANFYTRTNQLLDEIPNKPYGNDGIIFNRISDSYTKGVVYKWKPPELLTIDFAVERVGGPKFILRVKQDKSQNLLEFRGSDRFPFSGEITVDPPMVGKFPMTTGQIVEMSWNFEKQTFIPHRIRHDRDQPNNLSTALDVWRDIMNPIEEDTIRGTNFILMRKYHNSVKRNMLNRCGGGAHIVDIGGGRGGDIHKWRALGAKVLTVEPLETHLQELRKRLGEIGYVTSDVAGTNLVVYNDPESDATIVPIQGFGQETVKIVEAVTKAYGKESTNCMTAFNVLTFFFDKEDSLDALVDTVDQLLQAGGHFMGVVMDGQLVKELLIKHLFLKDRLKKLTPGQYYNLNTKQAINEKSFKKEKKYVNEKWRLIANSKRTLEIAVQQLQEPDPKTVGDQGWSITRMGEFTDSPFGNRIKIHLEDTIVTEQTEYLVDFDVLKDKLAEKNIQLVEDFFLSNENLPQSQQPLNDLYRSFVFKRTTLKPATKKITLQPLVGKYQQIITENEQYKKLVKEWIHKNQTLLDDALRKLAEFNANLADIRTRGEKISKTKSAELIAERKTLRDTIAKLKNKLTSNESELRDVEQQIADAQANIEAKSESEAVVEPPASRIVRTRLAKPLPVKPRTGGELKIIPTLFKKRDTFGDFEWMIEQPKYMDSLFIFNDNIFDHASTKRGGGNAIVRPYNKYGVHKDYPRSAGISTGPGYDSLTDSIKNQIDKDVLEIKELLKEYQYERIFWSSSDLKGSDLGTGIFNVAPAVRTYIVKQIKGLGVPMVTVPTATPKPAAPVAPTPSRPKVSESELIIHETERDPTDVFVAMEDPISVLNPEEQSPIVIGNTDFVRIGTVDGGCVLAALLRAGFPAYILGKNAADATPLSESDKQKRMLNIRKVMNSLVNITFKNAYNKNRLPLLSEYSDWQKAKKVLDNCKNWQWFELWDELSTAFKMNFVIVTSTDPFTAPHILKTGQRFDKTVAVYNHSGLFNVLAQKDAVGNLVTLFEKNDITISEL